MSSLCLSCVNYQPEPPDFTAALCQRKGPDGQPVGNTCVEERSDPTFCGGAAQYFEQN